MDLVDKTINIQTACKMQIYLLNNLTAAQDTDYKSNEIIEAVINLAKYITSESKAIRKHKKESKMINKSKSIISKDIEVYKTIIKEPDSPNDKNSTEAFPSTKTYNQLINKLLSPSSIKTIENSFIETCNNENIPSIFHDSNSYIKGVSLLDFSDENININYESDESNDKMIDTLEFLEDIFPSKDLDNISQNISTNDCTNKIENSIDNNFITGFKEENHISSGSRFNSERDIYDYNEIESTPSQNFQENINYNILKSGQTLLIPELGKEVCLRRIKDKKRLEELKSKVRPPLKNNLDLRKVFFFFFFFPFYLQYSFIIILNLYHTKYTYS